VSILVNFIPKLIKHLQHKCNRFEAGVISKHVKEWAQITSDKNLLDIVRGMRIPLTMTPTQTMGSAGSFSKKEEQAIASELHCRAHQENSTHYTKSSACWYATYQEKIRQASTIGFDERSHYGIVATRYC
jgi:hypothetical protein